MGKCSVYEHATLIQLLAQDMDWNKRDLIDQFKEGLYLMKTQLSGKGCHARKGGRKEKKRLISIKVAELSYSDDECSIGRYERAG